VLNALQALPELEAVREVKMYCDPDPLLLLLSQIRPVVIRIDVEGAAGIGLIVEERIEGAQHV
jgi:hypothetical protein